MITFAITHSILTVQTEKRVDEDCSLGDLKQKLQMVVGTEPEHMSIQVIDDEGKVTRTLDGDQYALEAFGLQGFVRIHVVDTDPDSTVHALTDSELAKVEKFEISEDAYSKRKDNFRNYKKNFLKDHTKQQEEKKVERAKMMEKEAKLAEEIKVGMRCEVGDHGKRGEVKFVGDVDDFGVFIGIQLDEPLGKHDGTFKGKRYFTCPDKYGVVVRASKVRVGDFPEKDPFDELDDDSDVMEEL